MNKIYNIYLKNDLDSFEKVSNFLNNEFGNSRTFDFWSKEMFIWKILSNNPAGDGYLAYAESEGKVIGTAAIVKKRIIFDNVLSIAFEIGETYTHPDFRKNIFPKEPFKNINDPNHYLNKSIFGRLVEELKIKANEEEIDFIYGTPNQNSIKGYLKHLNFFELKNYSNISMSNFDFIGFLKRKKYSILFKVFSSYNYLPKINNFRISREFPEKGLDDLWNKTKPVKGFSLVRDAQYWDHRYLQKPKSNYSFFSFYYKNSLEGIIVIRVENVLKFKTLHIVEWMSTKKIGFSKMINIVKQEYKNDHIEKYYIWTQRFSKNFFILLLKGFIPTHKIPIIFLNTKKTKKLKNNKFIFFLGSSDVI